MAEHTATVTRIGYPQAEGQYKKITLSINITSAGADGLSLTAGSGKLGDFRRIVSVTCQSSQENGGYVMQYVPTTLPSGEAGVGDGKVFVYEAGADAAALDEVESGDLGVFMVEVVGF
jgi:hypothetical protein